MWKSVVICLKPVGLKGGTANFGSLQVKLFFGIHHFLFSLSIWAFLFLYFPNLSQKKKKCLEQWRGISIKELDPLLGLWAQRWMIINVYGSYRWVHNPSHYPNHWPLHCLLEFTHFCASGGHVGWKWQSNQCDDSSRYRKSPGETTKSETRRSLQ